MYVGLWLVDGFPLLLVMVGILSHLCYGSLLSTFPVITLLSPGFIIGTRMWNYILLHVCSIYSSSMAIHAQSSVCLPLCDPYLWTNKPYVHNQSMYCTLRHISQSICIRMLSLTSKWCVWYRRKISICM